MSTFFERADNADVLQTLTPAQTQEQFILNYCAAAAAAFVFYDYVVTLGQERRYIWTNVRAGYAAIFLINRLNMLWSAANGILVVCSFHTLTSCKQITVFWDAAVISTTLIWACVSALRVYAISNRSILLAVTTAALAVVPIPLNIFSDVRSEDFVVTFGASTMCDESYTYSEQTGNELSDYTSKPQGNLLIRR